MYGKNLSLARTVVLNFVVEFADSVSRKVIQKGNIASSLNPNTPMTIGDVIVDRLNAKSFSVNNHISLYSYDEFVIRINGVELNCHGIFNFQGQCTLEIVGKNDEPTRINVVCA